MTARSGAARLDAALVPAVAPDHVDPIPKLDGRIPSLDGLRGIFCLDVVFVHAMSSPGAPDLGFRYWIGFKGYLVIGGGRRGRRT